MGIFPNKASAIRPVGAILADLHDESQATERRYLSEHSMAQLYPGRAGRWSLSCKHKAAVVAA